METAEFNANLHAARNGSVDAFATIFEAFRPVVFSVALRLVGSAEADDVVMDTYIKAWKALPGFDARASVKTWLFRITHNCALDHLRSRRRLREEPLPEFEDGEPIGLPLEGEPGPDEQVMRSELGQRIEQGMQQLPPVMRTTLLLRFADGLSYRDIATATGVSIGTVMSRIFNGRRRLQALLRKMG
jgi:RNA polymerase sigma-70 factor (ECF subfamily)